MVLGVTGGVGAGKSTILAILEEKYGAFLLEADRIGHEIQRPGEKGWEAVVAAFGDDILCSGQEEETPEGRKIDQKKLGDLAFSNPEVLKRLERILHPLIFQKMTEEIAKKKRENPEALIVVETAILFETGFDRLCDKTLYVRAGREIRAARLKAKRGYPEEKSYGIMEMQLDDKEFMQRADMILENQGELHETETELGRLLQTIWKFNFGEKCLNRTS